MKKIVDYKCSVCGRPFDCPDEAEACEARHALRKPGTLLYKLEIADWVWKGSDTCEKCHGTGVIQFTSPQGHLCQEGCDCRTRFADGVITPVTVVSVNDSDEESQLTFKGSNGPEERYEHKITIAHDVAHGNVCYGYFVFLCDTKKTAQALIKRVKAHDKRFKLIPDVRSLSHVSQDGKPLVQHMYKGGC